jgi:glycosyltransferase involved in cell wall biosynthesis
MRAPVTARLLYVVGQLGAGGLERQLVLLLSALDRERYRPAVAVWRFDGRDAFVPRLAELGVPVYPIEPVNGSRPVRLLALRSLAIRLRAEVVHSYSFHTNVAAFVATLGTPAVACGSVRSDFSWEFSGRPLVTLGARVPRVQVYNSQLAADTASRRVGVARPVVVRNGVDLAHYAETAPVPEAGPPLLLGIGSLLPYKRWERLVDVAVELRRRGVDVDVAIAGEGPSRASLEELAHRGSVGDRVRLLGFTKDVRQALGASAFLVHTSDLEGCPNAVAEAMAAGRAVVTTDVGDASYLVQDGVTGFVVPRGDGATLVDRVARLVADRALCRRMGDAGRARAERELSPARLVRQTLDAYRLAGWRDAERDEASCAA